MEKMVFLVYRIETFSSSKWKISSLKSNSNSLIKVSYTLSVRVILPVYEGVAIQMALERVFYV